MNDTNDESADDTTHQKINKAFAPINTNDRQAQPQSFKMAKSIKGRRLGFRRIILSVGFIVLVIMAGALAVNIFSRSNNGSASNQVKSIFSGEELKDYTSPENKFTVQMPGIPLISTSGTKFNDKDIPITTYERVIEDGTKNYTLRFYDYTGFQLDEPKSLESALNSALQNTPGAKIESTNIGKYNGLNAIEAKYNVAENDKIYEAHIRYVIKDSRMYSMILIGGDQAKFDQFANSLRLH